MPHTTEAEAISQGDDFSEKPRNVREFDSCQWNVRDFTKNRGNVREKICSRKSCLKLFIVSCIFASVQIFSRSLLCVNLNIKYMVSDHALLHSYPHHWQYTGMIWVTLNTPCAANRQGIVRKYHIVWRVVTLISIKWHCLTFDSCAVNV